ncbi:MAG: DUF4296 domain-containing protein [Bacteroidales bacterium]|nr:DUF4296 domain-containing protein [Bacteroidales bacterium]MBP5795430.1 DUF4296 domain-containing protein [Bacteroidales bacterium]
MKISAKILLAVASAALCVAACSHGPKVIPRSKMEKIYTDLFLADQWLNFNSANRVAADTTLYYEPIFRKYGYTTEDFNASVEYYMRDPLRFSRMLKNVALKMDAESQKLRGSTGKDSETELTTEYEEVTDAE